MEFALRSACRKSRTFRYERRVRPCRAAIRRKARGDRSAGRLRQDAPRRGLRSRYRRCRTRAGSYPDPHACHLLCLCRADAADRFARRDPHDRGLIGQVAGAYHLGLGLPADTATWARRNKDGYAHLAAMVSAFMERHSMFAVALAGRYPMTTIQRHGAAVHIDAKVRSGSCDPDLRNLQILTVDQILNRWPPPSAEIVKILAKRRVSGGRSGR